MSGLFGGLFDFNRDGKTDIFETALGLSIIDQAAVRRKKLGAGRRKPMISSWTLTSMKICLRTARAFRTGWMN